MGLMIRLAVGLASVLCGSLSHADSQLQGDPDLGFELLKTKAYLPADFDRETFDAMWAVWPKSVRSDARKSTPLERRKMTARRYGLHEHANWSGDLDTPPAAYVAGTNGWSMNCFACHGGSVAGSEIIYGLGNSHFAMHSFVSDRLAVRLRQFRRPAGIEVGSQFIPLNETDGKTNAVIFGIAVGASRDKDLNVIPRKDGHFIHHDMDAPPWWHAKKKSTLYCDAYAPKTNRVIMPFVMSSQNDGPKIRGWEDDFTHILAFIESVEAPEYPFPIDRNLAASGKLIFEENCSNCHGSYGVDEVYPEKVIDIDIIQTDPIRLTALTPEHRHWTEIGWLGRYGEDDVTTDPIGYLAPPLDGIWASAPYFHNGSVPTLWHLMHPSKRPSIWKRTRDGYDTTRVGLELANDSDAIPPNASDFERREYHDASRRGMTNGGHDFFSDLSEAQKTALIEYLKTL